MNVIPDSQWANLSSTFPPELVTSLRSLFDRGGSFETDARELIAELECEIAVADDLLEKVTPPLKRVTTAACRGCHGELDTKAIPLRCPHCDRNLSELNSTELRHKFAFVAPRTRDVAWVLALHGMNTRGSWQEEFNWRVATAYKRSIPVAIYKYGIVRPGALSRWYLRRLEAGVVNRVERLRGQGSDGGFHGPPDVIAHSLGTWLVGHALLHNPDLRFGRLLLTGSILRPDFDWATIFARGQVEAVLNHYGSRDIWAQLAEYLIPDSGPSGWLGFVCAERDVIQIEAEGFHHSDFFDERNLSTIFDKTWRPFLTAPTAELALMNAGYKRSWSSVSWPLRATVLRVLALWVWWSLIVSIPATALIGIYRICSYVDFTAALAIVWFAVVFAILANAFFSS